jgi:hypothetical protein
MFFKFFLIDMSIVHAEFCIVRASSCQATASSTALRATQIAAHLLAPQIAHIPHGSKIGAFDTSFIAFGRIRKREREEKELFFLGLIEVEFKKPFI